MLPKKKKKKKIFFQASEPYRRADNAALLKNYIVVFDREFLISPDLSKQAESG